MLTPKQARGTVTRKTAPSTAPRAKLVEWLLISRRAIAERMDVSISTVGRLLRYYQVPVYIFQRGPGLNCVQRYLASDVEKFLLAAARASHPGRRSAAPRRPGLTRG